MLDENEVDALAALDLGECVEKHFVPEDAPYDIALRCRRLDYVKVEYVMRADVDDYVAYEIDTLEGIVRFNSRLAGLPVVIRYKLA